MRGSSRIQFKVAVSSFIVTSRNAVRMREKRPHLKSLRCQEKGNEDEGSWGKTPRITSRTSYL